MFSWLDQQFGKVQTLGKSKFVNEVLEQTSLALLMLIFVALNKYSKFR